ncbi:hypothetical protein BASA50_010759 [Batrachochytrium salamandrivorans]|uniref:Extracellular metalloproteinase n=1 Tax=Batrachochytrium salamandrivorans TaxID=1357716 RepID=A0ABQ8EXR4_9FUNG|nr:hypothetical protein BASA50_010759 [Batrachochytrium salamandrivorans]
MVNVSFILVLALVSPAVVAQPRTNGFTGLAACFKRQTTSELSTNTIYERIPLSGGTLKSTSDEDSVKIGLSYILQKLKPKPNKFKVVTKFTDHLGATHVYGVPLYLGFPIANLHAAAHVKNGLILFYSAIIKSNQRLTKRSPIILELRAEKSYEEAVRAEISSEEAVRAAVDCLNVPFYRDIAPVMESYWTSNGIYLYGGFSVVVSSQDFKRDFTYTAIELPNENPRDGFSEIVNPENIQSSPKGWSDGFELEGNNALVSSEGGEIFKTTTEGIFNMVFDPISPPQTPTNIVVGVINAFYVTNMVHDVFYAYGFTEEAGNFQWDNFNRAGRLTGGARGSICMISIESRGLSEGYSDAIALIFMAKPEDTRDTEKVMGEYVKERPGGLRRYPYTTDMKVNPLTYQDAIGEKDIHRLGAIWASMLFEVYWNLVDRYGFSTNLHDATQKEGNIVFLQLLVGTLMIQPCNPTFDSAHDAMLAADEMYYDGVNEHLIRQGFAKRGLGSISQLDPIMDSSICDLPGPLNMRIE